MKLKLVDTKSDIFLCDRYEVEHCSCFDELGDAIKKLDVQFPDHKFLATLDDIDQACYTSMHTKMSHDLDSIEGASIDGLPPECFEEDGEHKGYFDCKEEFDIRKKNIEQQLSQVTLADVCDKGVGLYGETDFEASNNDHTSILDQEIYILKVPVEYSYETLYAFPNGYFTGDLNPFEIAVFARELDEKFGYELIGLGASYLAFRKTKALDDTQVVELLDLLNQVYSDDFNQELRSICSRYIKGNGYLILSYTE